MKAVFKFVMILALVLGAVGLSQPAPAAAEPEASVCPAAHCSYLSAVFHEFNPALVNEGTISGYVRAAATDAPLAGANVCYGATCVLTGSDGKYTLSNVPAGSYTLNVTHTTEYQPYDRPNVTVVAWQTTTQLFYLSTNILRAGDLRLEITWTVKDPNQSESDADANLWLNSGQRIYPLTPGNCVTDDACLERPSNTYGPEILYLKGGVLGQQDFGVTKNFSLSEYEITQIGLMLVICDSSGCNDPYYPPLTGYGNSWFAVEIMYQPSGYEIIFVDQICNSLPNHNFCT